MGAALEKETLAYQLARPGGVFHDFRGHNLEYFVSTYKKRKPSLGKVGVEKAAFDFYFRNHIVALIQQKYDPEQPLDTLFPIVENYMSMISEMTSRLFYYTLLIITRESRHSKHFQNVLDGREFATTSRMFVDSINGMGSDGAVQYLINHPPSMPIGAYVGNVEYLFDNAGYSSGYGGPPWGNIARTLRKMIEGEYTPIMFLDTGYTLAHNGGPMFNKGMLYKHQSSSKLMKLLDEQAKGKLVDHVNRYSTGKTSSLKEYITAEHSQILKQVDKVIGLPKEPTKKITTGNPIPDPPTGVKPQDPGYYKQFYAMPGVSVKSYETIRQQ